MHDINDNKLRTYQISMLVFLIIYGFSIASTKRYMK